MNTNNKKEIVLSDMWELNECFSSLLAMVTPYFQGGGCYAERVKPDPFTIWVYPDFEKPFCNGCDECGEEEKVINLTIDVSVPDVFFDWRLGSFCPKAVILKVNNMFAGLFCPKFQILALSDWTHDEECVRIAKKLFPILIEKLQLKRVNKKRTYIKFPNVVVTIGSDLELEELNCWFSYSPIKTSFSGEFHEIGADGTGAQLELRPAPSLSVREHVEDIRKLILYLTKLGVPVSVKGDRFPLGCHIHFGIPDQAKKFIPAFVSLLDDFLGKRLLELSGRARRSYKRLSAFEEKDWGFEYRTLPSAVLFNPEVARIVFKIAKNCVCQLLRKGYLCYNDPPTKEDYMKIAKLTNKEWQIFEEFVKTYEQYDGKPINANWIPKGNIPNFVIFHDDWSPERKRKVEKLLLKELERKKVQEVVVVRLYGIGGGRRMVCAGFRSKVFKEIPHPPKDLPYPTNVGDGLVFGLPWEFRKGDENLFNCYVKDVVKEIVEAIVETLSKQARKEVTRNVCNRY